MIPGYKNEGTGGNKKSPHSQSNTDVWRQVNSVEGRPFRIHASLIDLSKADIIREGIKLGVDYSQTVSCYNADEYRRACGRCESCRLRREGFSQVKVVDPTSYLY